MLKGFCVRKVEDHGGRLIRQNKAKQETVLLTQPFGKELAAVIKVMLYLPQYIVPHLLREEPVPSHLKCFLCFLLLQQWEFLKMKQGPAPGSLSDIQPPPFPEHRHCQQMRPVHRHLRTLSTDGCAWLRRCPACPGDHWVL